jgi:spermidine/putrescine transport system permease protein
METNKASLSRYFFNFAVLSVYCFLYLPIIVLILFSFNNNEFTYEWQGFTTKWYSQLFQSVEIWDALKNSFIVAITSVFLSLTMGVLLVFYSTHTFLRKAFLLFYGNLAVPEIVLAVGMLSFFSFFSIPLGLTSLIAGHTLLGLGYVVPLIHSRFIELNDRFTEASLDLGATQSQTLIKIILPLLYSSLVASGLLVFIISFDDFVISFFCSGATTQTLPMYIFSMIRAGTSPIVSALSTLLLVVSSILVLAFSSLQLKRMDTL